MFLWFVLMVKKMWVSLEKYSILFRKFLLYNVPFTQGILSSETNQYKARNREREKNVARHFIFVLLLKFIYFLLSKIIFTCHSWNLACFWPLAGHYFELCNNIIILSFFFLRQPSKTLAYNHLLYFKTLFGNLGVILNPNRTQCMNHILPLHQLSDVLHVTHVPNCFLRCFHPE